MKVNIKSFAAIGNLRLYQVLSTKKAKKWLTMNFFRTIIDKKHGGGKLWLIF